MGMFDDICVNCFHCNKETSSQTKLGACLLDYLKVGDLFLDDSITMNLILKNPCQHCNKDNCIKIVNGKINSVISPEEATHIEGYWSSIEKMNDANCVNNE